MNSDNLKRPGQPLEQPKPSKLKQPPFQGTSTDRSNNPLFLIQRSVYLLTSSPYYKQSYKVLAQISQPISRPTYVHQYQINQGSIMKAIALGYNSDDILSILRKYMRNDRLPEQIERIVNHTSRKYNCAKMYLEETEKGNFVMLELDLKAYKELTPSQLQEFDNSNIFVDRGEVIEGDKEVYRFKIKPYEENRFAEILSNMMMPFHTEYAYKSKVKIVRQKFKNDFDRNLHGASYPLKDLKIQLKTFTKLRSYQEVALKSIFFVNQDKVELAKSGMIVLPCGAGKTLLGISVACKIKKDTLIICSGEVAVEQWRREILKWTSEVQPDQIVALTSRTDKNWKRNPKDERGKILISSYPYLTSKLIVNTDKSGFAEYQWIRRLPWGLVVFDEVQWLPAENNQNLMYNIQCHCKIGLTATPYREDRKIECLNYLIGPILYEGNWRDFVDAGYLANPYCVEIRAKMTPLFAQKYQEQRVQKQQRQLLYSVNPNKIKALIYLVKIHEQRGDQTIIFCDSVPLINYVAQKLKRALVYSGVSNEDKNCIYDAFRRGKLHTILVSRTGDEAIDLPNANVAIELNIHKGSRKQVLQRLGRIMRQKDNPTHQYNAFFYTLISEDTSEKTHFEKRRNCLVDLGFQYDIINEKDLEYYDPTSRYFKIMKEMEFDEAKYLKDLENFKGSRDSSSMAP